MSSTRRQQGFTLVELVVAITLLGILSVVVVPMLRTPMSAYMDAAHRADLAAELDASVAKMRDDLAQALPNSIRVRQVGTRYFLEYLPVRAWGRYRAAASAAACPNDMLELGVAGEACFTTLGPLQGSAPVPGSDWVIVNPIATNGVVGEDPYVGGATAPAGGVKSRLTAVAPAAGGSRIAITPHLFPATAPASRQFYIVAQPVSYECNPATGRLTRYDGYAIAAVQPIAFPAAGAAPLATLIGACTFRYDPTGTPGRGGVVSIWLRYSLPSAGTGAPEWIESFAAIGVREPA
jgi:MSHA biogenesis protein MshO